MKKDYLFKSKLQVWDQKKMIYSLSMERKGYHYPQRNINQYKADYERRYGNE